MCDSADILSHVLLLVLEENGYFLRATRGACNHNFQVPVVQKLDSAIHRTGAPNEDIVQNHLT